MVWDLNNVESEVIDTLQNQQNMLSAYECAVCVNNFEFWTDTGTWMVPQWKQEVKVQCVGYNLWNPPERQGKDQTVQVAKESMRLL